MRRAAFACRAAARNDTHLAFGGYSRLGRLWSKWLKSRGFEIVQPELLSFPEQVELFRSASCVLGEHGSGMHAAVFANPGTIVATVGAWNKHQFNIAAAFGQRSICLKRHRVINDWATPPFQFTVTNDDLVGLFAMIDIVQDSEPADFGQFELRR